MSDHRHRSDDPVRDAERTLGEMVRVVRARRPPRESESRLYWKFQQAYPTHERRRTRGRYVRSGGAIFAVAAALLVLTWQSNEPGVQPLASPATATPATTTELDLARADRVDAPTDVATTPPSTRELDRWAVLNISEVGRFETDSFPDVAFSETRTGRRIVIERGTLRAEVLPQPRARPVTVQTPQLRVVVLGTGFDVKVENGMTTVSLWHGQVRVESAENSVVLEPGQTIRSDDARLAAPIPVPVPVVSLHVEPPPVADHHVAASVASAETKPKAASEPRPSRWAGDCARISESAERLACLDEASRGEGLSAQNALYLLGVQLGQLAGGAAKSLAAFETYARRFPEGALIRDVQLRQVQLLGESGRTAEVLQALKAFETRFGDDARLDQVSLMRARYLCKAGDRVAAGATLERLEKRGDEATRQAAAELRARCVGAE